MIAKEVRNMDENNPEFRLQDPQKPDTRPAWQVWLARIGLTLLIIAIFWYYLNIANGGLH